METTAHLERAETTDSNYAPEGGEAPSSRRTITERSDVEMLFGRRPLGKGAEGVVYCGYVPPRAPGAKSKPVAVKVMQDPSRELREMGAILRKHRDTTVKIHSQLVGPSDTWLVMELMTEGSVAQVVEKYNAEINGTGRYPIAVEYPEVVRSVAYQCLSALQWIHDAKFMHRDIKPDNFLVNKKGEVKLADFGTARMEDTLGQAMTYCGTSYYFSPERLKEEPYTNKGDIWGLGLLLLELMTCRRLFSGMSACDVFALVTRMEAIAEEVPTAFNLPEDTKGFLHLMLQITPHARLSATELLAQPYITEHIASRGDALERIVSFLERARVRRKSIRRSIAPCAAAIAIVILALDAPPV